MTTITAILDYFKEHTEAFEKIIEAMDDREGFLGDDRYYQMEEFDEILKYTNPFDLAMKIFNGADRNGCMQFNPGRRYFTIDKSDNLVSSDTKDYTDRLDTYTIDAMLTYRNAIDLDDIADPELIALLDDLAKEKMSLEEKLLRASGTMSDYDIARHLKDGVFVYDDFEDFKAQNSQIYDEDEMQIEWNRLDKAVVDGHEYRYDVVV